MIRRPPRSTQSRSSAASDVYKRQLVQQARFAQPRVGQDGDELGLALVRDLLESGLEAVSYTHLRAHETVLDLVCRLLLEKKKHTPDTTNHNPEHTVYTM